MIDIMCFCGQCFLGSSRNCPGETHQHVLDETHVNNEVDKFMDHLYDIIDLNPSVAHGLACDTYMRRFSTIQVLRENEALSGFNGSSFQTSDPFFAFATSLIKQHNTEFFLTSLRFLHTFDAKSLLHGFLNNYLNTNITPDEPRVKRVVYKEGELFRSKGSSHGTHSLLQRAKFTDHFALFFALDDGEENVILFDLATSKAHVMCKTGEVEGIIGLLRGQDITLSNKVFRMFEGEFLVKTPVLLFKTFMACYLHVPVFNSRWVMKSPEKSVNDYIFFEADNALVDKTFEYVKLNIEPVKKADMINNVFKLSFVGNDKNLLLPFMASLIALITKLENMPTCPDSTESDFIRLIQKGRFDIDRHIESFCSYRLCKKMTFKSAFVGLTPAGRIQADVLSLPVSYRPLAVPPAVRRRLDGANVLDLHALLAYATFFDSIDLNTVFNKNAPEITKREKLYDFVITSDLVDFRLREGPEPKRRDVAVELREETFFLVVKNMACIVLAEKEGMTLIDYPLEGQVKGLDLNAGFPRRNANKVHNEKMVTVDHHANNVLLKYATCTAENKTTCSKLASFSIELILDKERGHTLKEYACAILGLENASTLLSQHLWDHSLEERIKSLEAVDPYLHQDLLQHLFNSRIMFFEFNPRQNEYTFREPRYNGWYAINETYERVMFVFRAKNENLYTCIFDTADRETGALYSAYNVHLTDHIKHSYTVLRPASAGLVPEANEPFKRAEDFRNHEVRGQLIDSYGKCVGLHIASRNEVVRFPAQAPIMLPRQEFKMIERNRKPFLIAYPTQTKDKAFAGLAAKEHSPRRNTLLEQDDYSRQTMQNLSILFKTILKVALLPQALSGFSQTSALSRKEASPEPTGRQPVLEELIVERTEPLPHYVADKIYKLVRVPSTEGSTPGSDQAKAPSASLTTFLQENYPSVFWEGRFHVHNAPKTRRFIANELFLLKDAPPAFYKAFVEADLDITLVKQENDELRPAEAGLAPFPERELTSEAYLAHKTWLTVVKDKLLSNTNVMFVDNLTPELLHEKRIVLVAIEGVYHLVVETDKGEIETACYVGKHWKNTGQIASYDEQSILTTAYESYRLERGQLVANIGSRAENGSVKVLQYVIASQKCGGFRNKNRFASLLALA